MKERRILSILLICILAAIAITACGKEDTPPQPDNSAAVSQPGANPSNGNEGQGNAAGESSGQGTASDSEQAPAANNPQEGSSAVDKAAAADPHSIAVLVNKELALPEDYEPSDLVYPDVRFTFKEKIEKRMMRSEAAKALEEMFAGAERDGIYLAGVSAYRSHSTQTSLFNRYVARDGEEKAKTYSAVPGHSEHETGLAIDVSGSDGKCAAEDCFGGTKEAEWLAQHSAEYGFIIRYPEGKEAITGYKYEPWHLRYVGKEIAADIFERDITLEEYYDAVPVSGTP
ncbi:D-alanyl-D-alanine carboxypeptidase family protein [Paenibacillus woosongensis]|uniref:D-alanyl-D-alanine carboxypeptidase family protein n=1 Tax=Paenibacillus woosongensis TaxID=307580 RepID=A0AA95L0U0_9BACL|nr:D-alanyl-D-alanine carboxypeptidase family protein [Paenibacillus woosongensis]WHX48819.1 D-alanyl-D-alanine carboxypeptidase family protein [Paenibacillus woosongensis]